MMTIRGLSYNRACEYLEKIGVVDDTVEIKHNHHYDITVFKMNGEVVARYIEKYGRLDIR